MNEQPYHQLLAWKEANAFAIEVYRKTILFPKHEVYGLTSQLRRAALSISTNIVEGQAKLSPKDFVRYLNIAEGSSKESAHLLEFSFSIGYLDQESYQILEDMRSKADYLLKRLRKSQQSSE
ncbi:hypothetical protein A2318_01505 [Candidatus Uhrbacteria bacterium RIFOXYB2_FULL_45_11]|uniref:Four helix bundle protein n=1 Tax=Candidatus Uhrbacteria bacterium RIFOXYB2_FULL_45_11 TaxID=1802421 RepID=A0A1F7W9Y1_9BACT|nr:MAG: hypothetical protein A2318_01505 [Candidatus Uhrbacteria bacterium RIFOXYB2_FULL_45_11]